MSTATTDPERWSSRPPGPTMEAGLGAALRVAAAATLPTSTVRPPRARSGRAAAPVAAGHPVRIVVAVVCAVMGGAVWAMVGTHGFEERVERPPSAPAPVATQPQIEVVPVRAPAAPPPAAPPPAPPRHVAAHGKTSRPAPADEASLLWSAFRQLRQRHDARGALALLEQHRQRFPASALRVEADLARVEALLQLGRTADAAAVVQGLPAEVAGPARHRLGIPP